jgi:uncharacterized MAPEG superfamily protein
MAIELKMLGWSVCVGLVYVFTAAGFATWQRGLRWNAGNRDGEAKVLTGAAARAGRANQNFLETFPFFAAAVLALSLADIHSHGTALGAQAYLGARIVYLPLYIVGVPYVRTLVWAASLWGLLQLLEAWL